MAKMITITTPRVRRIYPRMVAHDVLSVQPMGAALNWNEYSSNTFFTTFSIKDIRGLYTNMFRNQLMTLDSWAAIRMVNVNSFPWYTNMVNNTLQSYHLQSLPVNCIHYRLVDMDNIWMKTHAHRQSEMV